MTNKPMLSVERELLENIALGLEKKGFGINWAVELRALLDAPLIDLLDKCGVQMVDCPECTHQWDHFFNCGNKPAAHQQGETVELQHMAVAEDGKLRWVTGLKMQNCELYAMPDGSAIRSKLYAEQPAPVAVELPELESALEAWWESDGQYCRAGGGSYEKTFAYRAYEAALAEVARLNGMKP